MTDFLKLLGLNSAAEEKQAALPAKAAEKQANLDPQRAFELDYANMDDRGFAAKYGDDAAFDRTLSRATARREEQQGKANRNAGEIARDGALAAGKFLSQAGNGLEGLALKGLSLAQGGNSAFDQLADMKFREDAALQKGLGAFDTDTTKINQRIVGRADAASEAEHRAMAEDLIDAGLHPVAAKTARVAADFGTGAKHVVENPTVLSNEIMGQAPLLAVGPLARAGVSAEAVAARAATQQAEAVAAEVAAGRTGAAAGSELAKRELLREARDHFASQNVTKGVTGIETVSNYTQAAEQILTTPVDQLAQAYPEYADRLQDPKTADAARSEIAHKVAGVSALITAPIAALSSRLTANFEMDPLHGGARPASMLANAASEFVEEGLQSGGGALAQNVGEFAVGNNQVDLLDGVGTQAGHGAASAAAGVGAMQMPGMIAEGATATGKQVVRAGKAVADKIVERADSMRTHIAETQAKQRDEHNAAMEAQIEKIRTARAATTTEEAPAPELQPVGTESLLAPETRAELGPIDRAQALGKVLGKLNSGTVPAEQMDQHVLFAAKTQRELRQAHTNGANPELDNLIDGLTTSPVAQHIEQAVSQLDPEALDQHFAALEAPDLSGETLAPEVEQAIAMAREVAYSAPDKMSTQRVDQAEQALFQRGVLTEDDKAQFELVRQINEIKDTAEISRGDIEKRTGFKSPSIVTQEVNETGFGKLKSVMQHTSSIVRSITAGDTQVAKLQMLQLQRFAQHMARKATEFDAAANQQVQDGSPNKAYPVDFKTLDENGKLTARVKARVNIHHDGGRGLIDAIFADAQTVTQAYNLLASTYPQLVEAAAADETPLAPEIKAPVKPTYSTATKKVADAAPTPATAPAQQPAAKEESAPRAAAPVAPAESVPVAEAGKPDAAPAAAPVPAVTETETESADAAFQRELAAAQAAFESGKSEGSVDFESDERASSEDLSTVLAMSDQEYLDAVNPDGETTSADAAQGLVDEELGAELEADAKPVRDLGNGVSLHARGDYLYAARDGKVVGVLGAKASGSIFAVDPAEQGKGIGKAMMRELLVRDPLHLSGGLSDAARRTRLSVLRDLRKELGQARTMDDRFPGLAEGSKFLSSFQLDKAARSFMARFPAPLVKLRETIGAAWEAKDPGMLRELFADDQRFLTLTGPQLQSLGQLLVNLAPAMAKQLNQNLRNAATGKKTDGSARKSGDGKTAKGFLQDLLDGKEIWNYENRLSLHAARWGTRNGKPFLEYQPEILQAMALAGMHWLMQMQNMPVAKNAERLAQLYPDGMPEELEKAYDTMHFHEAYTRSLARDIASMLGIKADPNASQSWTTGLPYALAQDTINALAAGGFVSIHEVATGTERNTVTFLKFDNDGVQTLRDRLESPQILTRLFYPDSATLPSIGAPPTQVPTRMEGSGQKLSADQREALRKQGQVKHTLNLGLIRGLELLGKDNVLKLRGFTEGTLDGLNATHRRAVEGKNRGLVAGWDNLQEVIGHVQRYAEANDLDMRDVPLHYAARMIGNTRIMLNATFNPQSNKLARETISATKVTLDLTDRAQREEYLLSIAQALGIKTERNTNAAAAEQITEKLSGERYKLLFSTLNELMDSTEEGATDIAEEATALMAELFGTGMTDRAIHALFNYARFLKDPRSTAFETYLAFEHDGVTNGPVNAMVQLGLWALDAPMLKKLRQGGLIIGDAKTTLNEWGMELGDLYRNAGATLQTKLRTKTEDKTLSNTQRRALEASIKLLARAKHVTLPEGGDMSALEVTREPGKAALMPMVYGSSARSVVSVLTGAIVDDVYAALSEAITKGEALPVELQQQLGLLMRSYKDQDGQWKAAPVLNLADTSKYPTFHFHPLQVRALVDNMMANAGKDLTNAVAAEVTPVLDTFRHLYAVSAMQVFQFRRAFEAKRTALREQLVAEGKLGPNDALSRADEGKILAELKDIAPVYQLLHNEAGSDRSYGINIADKDNGEHAVNGKVQKARSIVGGSLSLGIQSLSIPDAGVRIAALLVQALGDATMMTALVGANPNGTLAVFDGWETSPGSLKSRGLEANQAVLDSWKFDGLGAVVNSIASLQIDTAELSDAEAKSLVDALRIPKDLREMYSDRELIDQQLLLSKETLAQRADMTRRIKDAIFGGARVQASIDQMAGAMTPVVLEGDVLDEAKALERILTHVVNQQAEEQRAPMQADEVGGATASFTPNIEAADPYLREALKLNERGMGILNKFELQALLARYPFKNKLLKFVTSQIDHLLPEDLQVFIGDKVMVARAMAEKFPDAQLGDGNMPGVYYGNTLFITNVAGETLVHELVHATTYHLVKQFYRGAKGLTAHQRDAIKALEVLAREFATKDLGDHPTVEHAQNEVADHLLEGNVAEAVQEFLAWSLTNQHVADVLAKAPPSNKIKALAKKVLTLVRKILGLPNNGHMDSFLEQTLGQFHRLARTGATQKMDLNTFALFQSLPADPSTAHAIHVEDLIERFNQVLSPVNDRELGLEQTDKVQAALLQAKDLRDGFLDAGFDMTKREQTAFVLIQTALSAGIQLDSATLTAFQHLHDAAMKQLKTEDFITDPTDPNAHYEASNRFNALLDLRAPDLLGKSNLLANFVALALVHKPLRDKLTNLQMPVDKVRTDSVDNLLRSGAEKAFNWLANAAVHVATSPNQRFAMDVLTEQLVETRRDMAAEIRGEPNVLAQAEAWVRNQQHNLALYVDGVRSTRLAKPEQSAIDGYINGMLAGVHSLLDPVVAHETGESILSMLNEKAKLPKAIRELVAEFVGITDSNSQIAVLLNKSKHMVSRVRQRLRDEVPGEIRGLFSEAVTKEHWAAMHRLVGKTDLQVLHGSFSAAQLAQMLTDPSAMQRAIAGLENRLTGPHVADWLDGARSLARYMTGKGNDDVLLARNAYALARLAGRKAGVDERSAARATPFLDRLVTLYALQELNQQEQAMLAHLLSTEKDGMEGLLRVMRSLVAGETEKPRALDMKFNRWKGYVPESTDPRSDVVLAGPTKGAELLKMGYRYIGGYHGDSADQVSGMGYYAVSRAGGRSTYNQGAMQTVEGSIQGVDAITGRTLDPSVKTLIDHVPTVQAIMRIKRHQRRGGTQNLLPVFNEAGDVIAFERVLDRQLLANHLRTNPDLSKSIGMWMGRQAEEALANELNSKVVDALLENWQEGKRENREDEYVDVSKATDPTIADAWGAIPREIQRELKDRFDGPVMVRRDMVNNALGYRTASVADVFTGMSALPEELRKGLETAAYGILGKHAYVMLVGGERVWQSLVGSAKDWIVVRSGVVALSNAVANVFQLMQHGVNPLHIPKLMAKKVLETKEYLANEKRLAQIALDRETVGSVAKKRDLDREMQMLHDANRRLSIWPMIESGELPSVAEGLSEQDDYSILADATRWVEQQLSGLPKGVTTAAKYAYIAKDTALYQGLNRMIQFGDFTAKAVLFDQLMAEGKTREEAQRHVNETFVNYNLLPGRSRDYLESMGMTWFVAYKIRIQKIILRSLRENPLRFLAGSIGAYAAGADSLASSSLPATNIEYSLGPGQFFRAHDMLAWNQLMR